MKQALKNTLLVFGLIGLLIACDDDDSSPITTTTSISSTNNSSISSNNFLTNQNDSTRFPIPNVIQFIRTADSVFLGPTVAAVALRFIYFSDKPLAYRNDSLIIDSTASFLSYGYFADLDTSEIPLGQFNILNVDSTNYPDSFFVSIHIFPRNGSLIGAASTGSVSGTSKIERLNNGDYKLEFDVIYQDSIRRTAYFEGPIPMY